MISTWISALSMALAGATAMSAQDDAPEPVPGADIIASAPDEHWRAVDPENLVKITSQKGETWIETADAFAPIHTARIRELARMDWFDYKVWHRVMANFMAQGGGAIDNPSINAPTSPLQAEFTIRRNPFELEVSELQERHINPRSSRRVQMAGFWNGFQVSTDRAAAAADGAAGVLAAGGVSGQTAGHTIG